jgi:uncharacterized protein (TIGR02145 family)
MKTFLTLSLHLLITSFLWAQAPQGIPYQAVMRNADGSVMASGAVSLTFMIHDGSATGTVVYQESHALNSNAQGLVSCVVGNGVVSQGNFANINWGSGAKFLQVMMGTTDLGTTQMMSVPYALHAASTNVSISPTGDTLTIGGNSVIVPGISAANPNHGGLGSQVLAGNTTCANEYISVTGCGGQTSLTYDGRTYDLVEIGGQCWFADNLATDQYRNGDAIPTGLSMANWQTTTAGTYAINNNTASNDVTYGKLYNWFTTVDTRGLCPTGWHVPTDCEWMYLENSLGMSLQEQELTGYRGSEGGALKATTGWNAPNTGATNSSGFTALPGGYRFYGGTYNFIGYDGVWWSSAVDNSDLAWYRELNYNGSSVYRDSTSKQVGFSIRCLKDSETPILQGCTNAQACNYNDSATQDDGSCLIQGASCNDGNANTTNDVIDGNCTCSGVLMVNGCTNVQACNYNPSANVDNGSCLIPGASCNDGNANTANDVINANCQCAGTATGNGVFAPGNGVTDIDGNFYLSIIINGQEWMQKNLAVSKYRNGDPIPTGLSDITWSNTTSGAYALYNNDAANNTTYGKLYNWYAVNDSRGLCPTGWHVPNDAEWTTLINYLDPNQNSSANGIQSSVAGGKMKSTTGWNFPITDAPNESGFTGLPGGYRNTNGLDYSIGYYGKWWSSTESNSSDAWYRILYSYDSSVARTSTNKHYGFSVRCVRD